MTWPPVAERSVPVGEALVVLPAGGDELFGGLDDAERVCRIRLYRVKGAG
jgi:hypothetical protein